MGYNRAILGDNMKAVKAINLTKRFGTSIRKKRKIVALRNINFEIDEREHLAIMGPSPSGKTTLLKVIAGIYLPDEGDVEVYGISVRKKAKKVRRLTCYISPQIQLNKKLTIGETLRFFTKISGNKIVRDVRELLESVGITEKISDKRIEILSDAQVTVLKLALGLIKKPKVLLLDNIFGTLEPRVREIFSTAMEEICESTTLVMVDQELKVLDKFCEKILLLSRDGSMITIGSVENLLETYPYKYDIEVKCQRILPSSILDSMGYPYQKIGSLIRFYLSSEKEILDLTSKLLKIKHLIVSFQVSGIDAEDVYYWLISKE